MPFSSLSTRQWSRMLRSPRVQRPHQRSLLIMNIRSKPWPVHCKTGRLVSCAQHECHATLILSHDFKLHQLLTSLYSHGVLVFRFNIFDSLCIMEVMSLLMIVMTYTVIGDTTICNDVIAAGDILALCICSVQLMCAG